MSSTDTVLSNRYDLPRHRQHYYMHERSEIFQLRTTQTYLNKKIQRLCVYKVVVWLISGAC